MLAAIVCERMGWTYDTYLEQPIWFIKLLLAKWQAENEHHKSQDKKLKNKKYG